MVHKHFFYHCDDWKTVSCEYKEDTFLKIDESPRPITAPINDRDKLIFSFFLTLSAEAFRHYREAYNLLDFFGDIGGLFGLILGAGSIINSIS